VKVTWDEGKKMAQAQRCGEPGCGRDLVMAWDGDGYNVRCREHKLSTLFMDKTTPSQAVRRGESADPHIVQAMAIKEGKELRKAPEITVYKDVAVGVVQDAGTKKALTTEQIHELIEFASRFGLNIYRRHVCMMYGKPYIEIDGIYFKAHETGELDGYSCRPLTLGEKAEVGYDPTDAAWFVQVYRKGRSHPFEGRHRVTKAFLEERSERSGEYRWPTWRNWTDRMTEKQAQRYAFRLAFPDLAIWAEEPDEPGPEPDDTVPES